jgi:hypothetical protein
MATPRINDILCDPFLMANVLSVQTNVSTGFEHNGDYLELCNYFNGISPSNVSVWGKLDPVLGYNEMKSL